MPDQRLLLKQFPRALQQVNNLSLTWKTMGQGRGYLQIRGMSERYEVELLLDYKGLTTTITQEDVDRMATTPAFDGLSQLDLVKLQLAEGQKLSQRRIMGRQIKFAVLAVYEIIVQERGPEEKEAFQQLCQFMEQLFPAWFQERATEQEALSRQQLENLKEQRAHKDDF